MFGVLFASAQVGAATSAPAGTCGSISITENATQTIVPGSVSCNAGGLHTDNWYYRQFDLGTFPQASSGISVCGVQIGVEQAISGNGVSQPVTVNLYTSDPLFPTGWPGSLTLIGSADIDLPDQSLTTQLLTVTGDAPAGSDLVVEFFTPNGQTDGNSFFIGSNADPETAPSYLMAPDCGITTPTSTGDIGFPDMHIVMNVLGDPAGPPVPSVSKAFSPSSINAGDNSTLTITLRYLGATNANLTASLTDTLPAGVVVASTPNASTTCAGGSGVSATAGGSTITLGSGAAIPAGTTCTVTADVTAATAGTYVNTIPAGALQTDQGNSPGAASATLQVASGVVTFPPDENFDEVIVPNLPSGWVNTHSGAGNDWATQSGNVDSAPNAAFTDDPGSVSDKTLDSPSFVAGTSLTFRHDYETESTFDGAVLEISIAGAAFQDIQDAGGIFVTGGYNGVISTQFGSPIAGRQAWTGSSGGFVDVSVTMPPTAQGQSVQLRWRMASDSSVNVTGYYVDNIHVDTGGGGNPPAATVTPTSFTFTVAADATATDTLNIANAAGSDPLTYSIESRESRPTTRQLESVFNSRTWHAEAMASGKLDVHAMNQPRFSNAKGERNSSATVSVRAPNGVACTGAIVPWMTASPDSGSVAGGTDTDVTVTVDPSAGSLAPGSYTAELCVTTNDPTQALIDIPVSVTVTGGDAIFCDSFEVGGDGSCGSSGGTPGTYDDRTTFLANVAAGYFENPFDDAVPGPIAELDYTQGGFSYTVTSSISDPANSELYNDTGLISTNLAADSIVVTFTGDPVTAVGGNFWATDISVAPTGTSVTITLSDGTVETFSPPDETGFRGFVTVAPITTISIDAVDEGGTPYWPTMDNLIVGSSN